MTTSDAKGRKKRPRCKHCGKTASAQKHWQLYLRGAHKFEETPNGE